MEEPRDLEMVYDLIEGKISEDAYFSDRTDNEGKVSSNLSELNLLPKNMDLFGRYLLSLSLKGRMRILLHHQLLGFSTKDLYLKYAIHSEKLAYLKGQLQWQINEEKKRIKRMKKKKIRKKYKIGLDPFKTVRQYQMNSLLLWLSFQNYPYRG